MKRAVFAVCLSLTVSTPGFSQALTSLASVRVGYTTRKNTVKPQGEMKARIDALDAEIAEATRLGRTGELRRLYARGMTLLAGGSWTDVLDYGGSLVIRTDHSVADSSRPYEARIEQIYLPSIDLQHPLQAHILLRKRPAAAPGARLQPGEIVKDLGTHEGVGRDLRETPFVFEVDARELADGPYQLSAEVIDEARPIGTATLNIVLRKGLDDLVARLEAQAARAPQELRADMLYPVDRMKNVNRGRIELRTFDPDKDFAAAEGVASALASGRPPFARTGDIKRHYMLDPAHEILPYRLYVPAAYDGTTAFPLIVALHGLGGTEDAFFDGYNKALPQLAEQHGYIVAAPLGYRVDGSYGWGLGAPPADPVTRHTQELSERDLMQVVQRVREQLKVDERRIYLMGHSMGAIGTWKIAAKHPDIWAAIAPISGSGQPATIERFRHIPEIVVHGDNDPTVNVSGSRTMVAKMKELGTEVKYIEVPGGTHSDVAAPNFAAILDFFDAHTKTRSSTAQN
jgi:predicted esterase